MSLLLATAGENALTDTFLMARRQVLFPQLATTETGTWSWFGTSSSIFGGIWLNTSAQDDYIEWSDVVLSPGEWEIEILYYRDTNRAIGHVYFGGVDTNARLDLSGGSAWNQTNSDTFVVSAETRGALRISFNSTTGGGYFAGFSQVCLRKISGASVGSSLDSLPWISDIPPAIYDAASGSPALTQNTSYLFGSDFYQDGLNNELTYSVWLCQGNHTLYDLHTASAGYGIVTVYLDGVSVGTIDQYASSLAFNVLSSITNISVATTGVHEIKLKVEGKRAAAASVYRQSHQWIQFRKTTTTGAITATGTTYGRETLELWPWFADTTDSDTFALSASDLHYGTFSAGTPAINDSQNYAVAINSGTYDVNLYGQTGAASGIVHLSLDGGSDLDTVDLYSGSTVRNVKSNLSGSLASGTINLNADSKNASSSNYKTNLTLARAVRTGA